MKINSFEYEWITNGWNGPKGAAYNQTYEFLLESGLIDRQGNPTPFGYKAIEEYETTRN